MSIWSRVLPDRSLIVFFFNDTATPEIYTLSLHAALPICHVARRLPGAPPRAHPPVDLRVGDDRCLGCHSRSLRVALSYEGLAEIEPFQAKGPDAACAAPVALVALHDGRPACRVSPDVHREAGMACIDCHLHTDLMGDGTARAHKEEPVEVTCEVCHGPARQSVERACSSFSRWTLVRKLDGVVLPVKQTPRDANHARKGHELLACSSCHAAWAPTCDTCHTSFDPGKRQWDFAAGKETAGAWVERSEGFSWAPPLLGVRGAGRAAHDGPQGAHMRELPPRAARAGVRGRNADGFSRPECGRETARRGRPARAPLALRFATACFKFRFRSETTCLVLQRRVSIRAF